jgi:hypothetical protein
MATGAAVATLALGGMGLGLAACQHGTTEKSNQFIDTGPRITGDPAVSARVDVIPEGTAPFDAPITELSVSTNDSLPTPVETTCLGGGQDVILTLKSGRQLDYPFCAMPEEIAAIRDAAWAHDGATTG